MGRSKNNAILKKIAKKKDLFKNRLATLLLVQSKLLPPSALGVKNLNNKI